MDIKSLQFAAEGPYPEICVEGPNRLYARAMLKNVGSCHSEISTITLYIYNSMILKEESDELSECFRRISIVEMHHLNIFGCLARLLGADPRLWSVGRRGMQYWSPGCSRYLKNLEALIENAVEGETQAIQTYRSQCGWIQDSGITANLERIIKDEEVHISILQEMYREFCMGAS